jgi:hypothetical protein
LGFVRALAALLQFLRWAESKQRSKQTGNADFSLPLEPIEPSDIAQAGKLRDQSKRRNPQIGCFYRARVSSKPKGPGYGLRESGD